MNSIRFLRCRRQRERRKPTHIYDAPTRTSLHPDRRPQCGLGNQVYKVYTNLLSHVRGKNFRLADHCDPPFFLLFRDTCIYYKSGGTLIRVTLLPVLSRDEDQHDNLS